MSLSFTEQAVVTELATLLNEFLPASGNNTTSFPLAAAQASHVQGWPTQPGISKRPGITHLVIWTLELRRDRFYALIEAIVGQSMQRRNSKPDSYRALKSSTAHADELGYALFGVEAFVGWAERGLPELSARRG
jgi:hypothetical protein